MVKRRKVLIGMGSLAAGTAAATGTGAFTSASLNNRDVSIDVTADGGGLLALEEGPGANGDYITDTDTGIQIDLSTDYANGGDGVNADATYDFENLFTIANYGEQAVAVFVVDHTDGKDEASGSAVTYYNDSYGKGGSAPYSLEGPGPSAVRLDPGESINVSVKLDTSNLKDGDTMRNRVSVVGSRDVLENRDVDPGPGGAGAT